jgi:hypothetical protein
MEWSKTHDQRGFVASWPQFGVPCGLFLSNLAVLAFSFWTGDQFNVWGPARSLIGRDECPLFG